LSSAAAYREFRYEPPLANDPLLVRTVRYNRRSSSFEASPVDLIIFGFNMVITRIVLMPLTWRFSSA
jgi:hypothetical protein